MSNLTKSVNVTPTQNNNLVANNLLQAANNNQLGANLNQNNTIVKMSKNIPVDTNSEIPHHERWNDDATRCPDPVPNGGLYGGPQAVGDYASIHVIPTATNMIHYNLRSANPPPGAINQFPGTNRDRNNYIPMPGVFWYNDTHEINKGPYSVKVTEHHSM